jgi:hypothetical protein
MNPKKKKRLRYQKYMYSIMVTLLCLMIWETKYPSYNTTLLVDAGNKDMRLMKTLKLTVNKYDKTFCFDISRYCGYVMCDKTKKVFPISMDAEPMITKKGLSFQCDGCGCFTDDTPFHHTLIYKGREIKYGEW